MRIEGDDIGHNWVWRLRVPTCGWCSLLATTSVGLSSIGTAVV